MKRVFFFFLLVGVSLAAGGCILQAVLRESVQSGMFGGILILAGIILAGEMDNN